MGVVCDGCCWVVECNWLGFWLYCGEVYVPIVVGSDRSLSSSVEDLKSVSLLLSVSRKTRKVPG